MNKDVRFQFSTAENTLVCFIALFLNKASRRPWIYSLCNIYMYILHNQKVSQVGIHSPLACPQLKLGTGPSSQQIPNTAQRERSCFTMSVSITEAYCCFPFYGWPQRPVHPLSSCHPWRREKGPPAAARTATNRAATARVHPRMHPTTTRRPQAKTTLMGAFQERRWSRSQI